MSLRRPRTPRDPVSLTSAELARATRLITIRSQRDATGLFVGNYASAFRGGGLEFEESRPYVAGDDVRSIDWVTTARIGEPYVKRFREERNHTLIFALDTSASMHLGGPGRHKAALATRAIALLTAAAARAGDRSGLILFDSAVRTRISVGRGRAHSWNLIRRAAGATENPYGGTDIRSVLRSLRTRIVRRPTIILLSDFRDPNIANGSPRAHETRRLLRAISRQCDVVAIAITDPREERLPSAGVVRLADPEDPHATVALDTSSQRIRRRYERAFAAWRHATNELLRSGGAETLWLRLDQDPLHALGRFFESRVKRRHPVQA